jgi:hypothetical protein
MARTPNYDQDKRRKELERKNRKEAKRLDREQRRLDKQSSDPEAPDDLGAGDVPGEGAPQA